MGSIKIVFNVMNGHITSTNNIEKGEGYVPRNRPKLEPRVGEIAVKKRI